MMALRAYVSLPAISFPLGPATTNTLHTHSTYCASLLLLHPPSTFLHPSRRPCRSHQSLVAQCAASFRPLSPTPSRLQGHRHSLRPPRPPKSSGKTKTSLPTVKESTPSRVALILSSLSSRCPPLSDDVLNGTHPGTRPQSPCSLHILPRA